MKKFIFSFIFLFTISGFSQTTSHWGATLLNSLGQPLTGLTNVTLYYSGGALAYNLTEQTDGGVGTGYYYHDNVAIGLYDLKVGATTKKAAFWIGANLLTLMANNLNASGQLGTSGIQDDAITSAKINTGAVTSTEILDGTVALGDLDASLQSTITTAGYQPDNVTVELNGSSQLKVKDASITSTYLADNAVTSAKIVDGTIAASDIASNAITSAKIAPENITTSHIADANITGAKIANRTVGNNNLDPKTDDYGYTYFADGFGTVDWGQLPTESISNSAITSVKILDGTIAMADLSTAVKDSIRLGYTGTGLSEGSVTSTHILDGTIASGDLSTSLLNNVEMWKHVWNDSMVKTIGGVLRQDSQGSGWYAIDNSNHYPLGVFTVSNETNSGINVTYDATEYSGNIRGTFIAVTDEALAGKGVFLGSSVNVTRALIELHARIKITGRIYNSGGLQITIDNDSDTGEFRSVSTTNWNTNFGSTGAMSISYSGIVSTGTVSVKATPRIAGGYIPSAQVSGSTVTFYMTDYAGSVVTTADANCDFTFEIDLGVCHLDPNKVYGSLANIWFWGVFYVDQP